MSTPSTVSLCCRLAVQWRAHAFWPAHCDPLIDTNCRAKHTWHAEKVHKPRREKTRRAQSTLSRSQNRSHSRFVFVAVSLVPTPSMTLSQKKSLKNTLPSILEHMEQRVTSVCVDCFIPSATQHHRPPSTPANISQRSTRTNVHYFLWKSWYPLPITALVSDGQSVDHQLLHILREVISPFSERLRFLIHTMETILSSHLQTRQQLRGDSHAHTPGDETTTPSANMA